MNIQINTAIASEVLSAAELSILKGLINKVKDAEVEMLLRKEECDCFDCKMKEAIESTTEEITPELLVHFAKSISGKNIKIKINPFDSKNSAETSNKGKLEDIFGPLDSIPHIALFGIVDELVQNLQKELNKK